MRTRRPALVALLIGAMIPLAASAAVVPAAAAPADTVVSDGWQWEVLTGESDLFGEVIPPGFSSAGDLSLETTAPALRAPSFPQLFAFILQSRWTASNVVVSQPVAGGIATVTADYAGAGGTAEVTAVIDGGTVEYTIVLPSTLSSIIGLDYNPAGDGYTAADFQLGGAGPSFVEIGGWFSGSATHHSAAWALDQLDADPNRGWVVFLEQTSAAEPVDLDRPLTSAATTSGLVRGFLIGDGAVGFSTPADTWIARVSLVGGAGCAVEESDLAALAASLTSGTAAALAADGTGCLTVDSASGAVGVPLDVLLPIALDPALASTSWWADRAELELLTGSLPAGVTASLELVDDEPFLRLRGTPESAGSTTVPLALGGASTAGDIDLVDAVGGQVVITIAPALAATGAAEGTPAALGLGTLLLLALGALAVTVAARRRPHRVG